MCGIQKLGGIPTTMNPTMIPEEMKYQIKDSGAIYFVTIPQLMDKVKEAVNMVGNQIKEVIVIGEASGATSFSSLIHNDGQYPKEKFDPITTVAIIPYSSGTTGLPKGVELTHYNVVANLMQLMTMQVGIYREHDTLIGFVPFFHIYGIVVAIGLTFRMCHTLVVMPRFDPVHFFQIIQEYKVTVLPVVPPVVLLLAHDPIVSKYDLSSVRVVISAASPLGQEQEQALKKRMPNILLVQAMGMTELSPLTHTTNVFTNAPGSVGQLVANMKLKIIDVETGKELGINQKGELWMTGPNVMKGYLHNPKATSETIDKDGYLHTGDVGYVDENLNMYIVDRVKELVKYKGFQVAPAELEALLLTHPDIADVAVIGKPDEEAGEVPLAFVVLKKDHKATEKEIVAWAEKKTAHYKKLRGGVRFVEAIPKSASGKILRRLLRAKL
eukprot:Phypoly_transcript_04998.p1 GENE.Phypoly_transcript_04998~~Phypoly_transcript_04998.p1  ORF type:complete len:440 (+),score=65.65 Phypoly_transcript_04998:698-2017(+)